MPEVLVALLIGEAVLVQVGGVDDGLQAQKLRAVDELGVVPGVKGPGGLPGVQMGRQALEDLGLMEELLVTALGQLRGLLGPAAGDLQVRHDELQVDGLDVPQGVHRHVGAGVRHHVHDVLIVEAAYHMDDGVRAADILQKLVAKARALGGAFYKARNVHELHHGGSLLLGLIHLSQLVQPLIRHRHHADIGLDGAEGVVGALRSGIGDGVEKGGLAHIGQPHDT